MLSQQILKRSIVILILAVTLVVIGLLLYFSLSPKETCFDHKKNQNEREVDCGGICSPCKLNQVTADIQVNEKNFVSGGNNTFDTVVRISNPNDTEGASSFHYTILLKDDFGNVLSIREGSDYILPADTKYVVQLGLDTEGGVAPSQMDFLIDDVKWSQLTSIEKPQLSIYDKKFGPSDNGIGSIAEGVIRNESSNDFKKIDIVVILRDENGNVLGVSTAHEENVRSKKEGNFVLTWPYGFPRTVRTMEVDAQTNILDNQNFAIPL